MMKFLFMMIFMMCIFKFYKKILYLCILNFSFNYFILYISYDYGMDLLSFMMILLSFWICSLMIMSSEKNYLKNNWFNLFLMVMLFLMISLFMTFSSLNFFIFYIFFKIKLIPTLILIMSWGYQPERLQAGIYLLFYTLLASSPMMIFIFYLYEDIN